MTCLEAIKTGIHEHLCKAFPHDAIHLNNYLIPDILITPHDIEIIVTDDDIFVNTWAETQGKDTADRIGFQFRLCDPNMLEDLTNTIRPYIEVGKIIRSYDGSMRSIPPNVIEIWGEIYRGESL